MNIHILYTVSKIFWKKKTIARIINHHRKAEAEKKKYIGESKYQTKLNKFLSESYLSLFYFLVVVLNFLYVKQVSVTQRLFRALQNANLMKIIFHKISPVVL